MQLHRRARKWLDIAIDLEDGNGSPVAGAAIEASFNGGITWLPADTAAPGGYRWLLDGPDLDLLDPELPTPPEGVVPVRILNSGAYYVRAIAGPETEVESGQIYVVG